MSILRLKNQFTCMLRLSLSFHNRGFVSATVKCFKCGKDCDDETLVVADKHFHAYCLTCAGESLYACPLDVVVLSIAIKIDILAIPSPILEQTAAWCCRDRSASIKAPTSALTTTRTSFCRNAKVGPSHFSTIQAIVNSMQTSTRWRGARQRRKAVPRPLLQLPALRVCTISKWLSTHCLCLVT